MPISERKEGKNRQKKFHGASCIEERKKFLVLFSKFSGVAICDVPADVPPILNLDSIVSYKCCQPSFDEDNLLFNESEQSHFSYVRSKN